MAKFQLICEESPALNREVDWPEGHVPPLVRLPDGTLLKSVGRYFSPGERVRYVVVTVTDIP